MPERSEAVELVLVDQSSEHRRARGGHRQDRDHQHVSGFGAGDQHHAHGHHDQHRGRAEVGLEDDQDHRRAHEQQPDDEPVVGQIVAAILSQIGGHGEKDGELGELCRLEVERAEVEAEGGTTTDRAHHDHQYEQHQGEAVEELRMLVPPFVVEGHHNCHRHHGDDEKDLLPGDEGEPVGLDAAQRELGVRR